MTEEADQVNEADVMDVVAAFDVDGTLTVRDCVAPFLIRVGGKRALVGAVLRHPIATLAAAARRDRDALKEVVVGGVLRGRSAAQVARIGAQFAAEVHTGRLRPDTVERLRWHQAAGHRTVLVSASLGVYLRPLARLLGVDAVIATEVAVAEGCYTAHLDGRNCRGPEKARRLVEWLEEHELDTAELWAYGDSRGDRELLALASRAEYVSGVEVPAVPAVQR